MAEIDDFTIFLVAGLMILAIMLAVFNFGFEPGPAKKTGFAVREVPFYNISTAIAVGPQQFSAIRTFTFTFDASNLREARAIALDNQTLQNGVLFGEHGLRYRLLVKEPSRLDVSFKVVKSNELEPLVLQVNGRTVSSSIYGPGEYTIRVDNSLLSEDMLVSMNAASSGWRIWAPNLYELQDIRLDAEGYQEKASNFIFSLGNESRTFTFGKVDIALLKNVGRLNVTLNYNRLYSAPPSTAVSFQFLKSDLQEGDNVLGIAADKDAEFKGTGVITIYYLKERTFELRTPLNLTQTEYDFMNRTVMRFNAVNVARPGGLAIKLENRNGVTFRDFAAVDGASRFEFVLGRGNLGPGMNILTISSLDNAVFDVTDLDIKLR